jgi:nitrite reductase (NO-forming)
VTNRLYQTAARLWLTAAGAALLLPPNARLGWWLPLHLAMAGAVATAISGAMQTFAGALTATPPPPAGLVLAQFALVNAGAAGVTAGMALGARWLVGAGGAGFVVAMGLLGWFVVRARRRALHLRHRLPVAGYLFACGSVVAGGTLGGLVGSGAVGPGLRAGLALAHPALNVLGFAGGTILATLVTLLPTVLRVRMPRWHGGTTAALYAAGVAGAAAGLGWGSRPIAAAGGAALAAAALGVAWLVRRVLATPRRWPVPLAAKHLVAGVGWFLGGTLALAWALARGPAGYAAFRPIFLLALVGGWVLQTLLGAWLYLLPMARPGHPDERRRQLAVLEVGGDVQVAAGNVGLVALVLRAGGWAPAWAGAVGGGLALGAAAVALGKAWLFAPLAEGVRPGERELGVWGA